MKANTEKDEKICWACKRILVGGSTIGLCPDCLNNYGTKAAKIGIGGLGLLGIMVWKNGGEILKGAIDGIKGNKS